MSYPPPSPAPATLYVDSSCGAPHLDGGLAAVTVAAADARPDDTFDSALPGPAGTVVLFQTRWPCTPSIRLVNDGATLRLVY